MRSGAFLLVVRHQIHRVLGAIVLGIVVASRVQEKPHGGFEPACACREQWRHPLGRAALQICAGLHQMLDEVDALVPWIPRVSEKAQSRVPVRHTPLCEGVQLRGCRCHNALHDPKQAPTVGTVRHGVVEQCPAVDIEFAWLKAFLGGVLLGLVVQGLC